ncbi:NUDIX hydrolase [Flaviflexus equikiangi]|uniref:NUDIX hydrolase n=1 Tax=Flaviflexus equikiangi TaxID=2758573 RepID=UPI002175587B|nr:NUDIX domain-containing protein [Flaviflexus equikiangi]
MSEEWTPGADGLLERSAARIVLLDPEGRLFLMKGHDLEDPDHAWWFTVGGGINPGEDPRAGAIRELFEETGLEVDPRRLIGPVLQRTALFRFTYENRRQYEQFFLLHVSAEEAAEAASWNTAGLTDLEKDVLDGVAWWQVEEIERAQEAGTHIYPLSIGALARRWRGGWDGIVHTVREE